MSGQRSIIIDIEYVSKLLISKPPTDLVGDPFIGAGQRSRHGQRLIVDAVGADIGSAFRATDVAGGGGEIRISVVEKLERRRRRRRRRRCGRRRRRQRQRGQRLSWRARWRRQRTDLTLADAGRVVTRAVGARVRTERRAARVRVLAQRARAFHVQ